MGIPPSHGRHGHPHDLAIRQPRFMVRARAGTRRLGVGLFAPRNQSGLSQPILEFQEIIFERVLIDALPLVQPRPAARQRALSTQSGFGTR